MAWTSEQFFVKISASTNTNKLLRASQFVLVRLRWTPKLCNSAMKLQQRYLYIRPYQFFLVLTVLPALMIENSPKVMVHYQWEVMLNMIRS
jgi:hypothetical protein